jgi:hypothetical protein
VVAHYAISSVLEHHPDIARLHAYHVARLHESAEAYQGTALRIGRVRVGSEVTGESRELVYAVIHFGSHDFSCGVRAWEDAAAYETMKKDLLARYADHRMADMVRGMDKYFPGEPFGLRHLFLEGRRRLIAAVTHAALERHEETFRQIWGETRMLVRYLGEVDAPVPEALALAGRHVMETEARTELEQTLSLGAIPARVFELATEARALGLALDLTASRPVLRAAVSSALTAVAESPTPDRVNAVIALVEGARVVGVGFDRWAAQNRVFELWRAMPSARRALSPLAEALDFALGEARA